MKNLRNYARNFVDGIVLGVSVYTAVFLPGCTRQQPEPKLIVEKPVLTYTFDEFKKIDDFEAEAHKYRTRDSLESQLINSGIDKRDVMGNTTDFCEVFRDLIVIEDHNMDREVDRTEAPHFSEAEQETANKNHRTVVENVSGQIEPEKRYREIARKLAHDVLTTGDFNEIRELREKSYNVDGKEMMVSVTREEHVLFVKGETSEELFFDELIMGADSGYDSTYEFTRRYRQFLDKIEKQLDE